MDLIINEEYKALLPKLNDQEYNELKESIKNNGLIYPIIINRDNVILDGYHRYAICKELHIEPNIIIKEFNDKLEEKEFVIEVNLKRRHLDIIQKCELAEKIETIEKERARIRQLSTIPEKGKKGFRSVNVVSDSDTILDIGRSAKIASKKVGISYDTYARYKVIKKYYPDIIPKIKDKKVSINHAYGEIKRIMNMNNNSKPKLIANNKRYNVILADPPYDYNIKLRGNPSIHYKTLSDEQIYSFLKNNNLEDKIDDNAILFLWATNPKLREALKTIEEWNFEYKTNMV